jgi:group I intron endonuclease
MIVYLVTNLLNGFRYVGVTIRPLEARWKEHAQRSKQNAKFKLGRAIQKYGPSAFLVEVLCELDDCDDLLEAERIFVANLGTHGANGYNMTPGGERPPTLVKEIAARGGRTRSERIRGPAHPNYGRKWSAESREKHLAAIRRNAGDTSIRQRLSEAQKKSWQDPASRERRVSALKGKPKPPRSDEHRRRISDAKRGVPYSAEIRERLSRRMIEVWAERKRKNSGHTLEYI